jgi:hypothetical protein
VKHLATETDDSIRVLVVDDHAVVRRGLLAFLGSEDDFDVIGEASGGGRRSTSSPGWTRRSAARTSY